jgi:hypothetical protein
MNFFPQFFALPITPLVTAAPAGGVVAAWPFGLAIFAWLVSAALVGTLLGMLREHTAGEYRPSVREHRPRGHEPRLPICPVHDAA